MKEKIFFYDLRAYLAFVAIMILSFSCCPEEYYLLPTVVIKPADNVKMTSATMVASVKPNENGTQVSFEFKKAVSGAWTKTLPLTYGGQDTVNLTSDLSGLETGTEYSFRVKASNKAGTVVSDIGTFCTYAIADIDGNLYHTVKIGNQVWLKENLKVTHYRNGDPIPNVTDPVAWGNLTTGAYCWYNNDPKIGEVYGALYNWYVGADSRGLIEGWHVPTFEEWLALETFLGGQIAAYPKMIETGSAHWKTTKVPATNSSGFTALPNGGFGSNPNTCVFMELGDSANWWSSSLFGGGADMTDINACDWYMSVIKICDQRWGFGIRLVKDTE